MKKVFLMAAFSSSLTFAGPKLAVTNLTAKTKVAVVKLKTILGKDATNTVDTAFAVVNKEGKLVEVVVTGQSAANIYAAALDASVGASQAVTDYAFSTTTDAVVITGGAANYALEASLGTTSDLLKGVPGAKYTVIPLLDNTKAISRHIVNSISKTGVAVVSLGGDIVKNVYGVAAGILTLQPKAAGTAVVAIVKDGVVGAPKTALEALGRLFGCPALQ